MMTWELESGLCPRCWKPNRMVPATDEALCVECQEEQVDAAEEGVRTLARRLAERIPKLTPAQCVTVAARRRGGP